MLGAAGGSAVALLDLRSSPIDDNGICWAATRRKPDEPKQIASQRAEVAPPAALASADRELVGCGLAHRPSPVARRPLADRRGKDAAGDESTDKEPTICGCKSGRAPGRLASLFGDH